MTPKTRNEIEPHVEAIIQAIEKDCQDFYRRNNGAIESLQKAIADRDQVIENQQKRITALTKTLAQEKKLKDTYHDELTTVKLHNKVLEEKIERQERITDFYKKTSTSEPEKVDIKDVKPPHKNEYEIPVYFHRIGTKELEELFKSLGII